MVFKRDNKGDAFQRQISALRQQLGAPEEDEFDEGGQVEPDYQEEPVYARTYEPQPEKSIANPTPYEDIGLAVALNDPELPAHPAVEAQTTVISHNTSWKGELNAEGSIHLHGVYDGVITAKEDVYILEEAQVTAQINAARVVIAGRYDGVITCKQRLEVLPTGRAQGEFRSPVLVVHEGAMLGGKVSMTGDGLRTLGTNRPRPTKNGKLRDELRSSATQ